MASKGWNTEMQPRKLFQGQYAEFENLTLATGAVTPRRADAVTAGASDKTKYFLEIAATSDFTEVYNEVDKTVGVVDVDYDVTQDLRITDDYGVTTMKLIHDVPGEPVYVGVVLSAVPVTFPDVVRYAATISDPDVCERETGLSGVYEWTKANLKQISATIVTGSGLWALENGTTVTNTTKSSTGKSRNFTTGAVTIKIIYDTKSDSQVWDVGDTISYVTTDGTVTATISVIESAPTAPFVGHEYGPIFMFNGAIPVKWNQWKLYRLDDASGIWRSLGDTFEEFGIGDDGAFPYDYVSAVDYQSALLPEYPGPLDVNSLPEDLVTEADMDTSNGVALCTHKGCLFVALGNIIRVSEPEEPGYFRRNYSLQAFAKVIRMVSRDDRVEVYTEDAIKYIFGNSPNWEIRETGITEGPIAQNLVCGTDIGTFALYEDGIYLCAGNQRKNVTAGYHTTWLNDHNQKLVAGRMFANHGVLFLVDTNGEALCYDWEHDEFYHRHFEQGQYAIYDGALNALVYTGTAPGTYYTVETANTAVDWLIKWRDFGDGNQRKTKSTFFVDADGTMLMRLLFEGQYVAAYPITEPGTFRLPKGRARYYSFEISGSGSDQVIREVKVTP